MNSATKYGGSATKSYALNGSMAQLGSMRGDGSAEATLLRLLLRSMFGSVGERRKGARDKVVGYLKKARNKKRCIDELLNFCANEGGPSGLDAGIDVLSKTGKLIFEYALDYWVEDVKNWTPRSDRAYRPNDDYWHILLRSVARSGNPESARLRFVCLCQSATSRGIREAVVEALGDLNSAASRQLLAHIGATDTDPFIKRLANDTLEDMES